MQVVRDILRESWDESIQEHKTVSLRPFAGQSQKQVFYIGEDHDEELEHLKRRTTCLTKGFNSLESWLNYLNTVDLYSHLSPLGKNLDKLGQCAPNRFEKV